MKMARQALFHVLSLPGLPLMMAPNSGIGIPLSSTNRELNSTGTRAVLGREKADGWKELGGGGCAERRAGPWREVGLG